MRLLQSLAVEVPTAIGWLCPVILLPASSLLGLNPAQVESILAHELAHIGRHDYLVNLLQCLAETLLFYHPAVWWVSKCIRAERENCCDDLAVKVCGDALSYARALAALEEIRSSPGTLAMAANGKPLLQRIRRLLLPGNCSPKPRWKQSSASFLSLLLVMAAMLALPHAHSQKDSAEVTPTNLMQAVTATKRAGLFFRPGLYTRVFKIDPHTLIVGLNQKYNARITDGDPAKAITALTNLLVRAYGVDLGVTGKTVLFDNQFGALAVRASEEDMAAFEKLVQILNEAPPQLTFEVKVAELVEYKESPFDIREALPGQEFYQSTNTTKFTNSNVGITGVGNGATRHDLMPTNGFQPPSLAILTEAQFRLLLEGLEQDPGVDFVNMPKVTTLSSRQAKIKVVDTQEFPSNNKGETEKIELGPIVDVVGFVNEDKVTISLTAIGMVREFFGVDPGRGIETPVMPKEPVGPVFRERSARGIAELYDGQTLLLDTGVMSLNMVPLRSNAQLQQSRLMFFVTPRMIDPAGNRIHTEEQIPFATNSVPPQVIQ